MSEPCDWCDGYGGIAISGPVGGPVYECQKCKGIGQLKRGGKRKGAGRKPAPEGTAKVPYGTKLDPQVVEYLRQCENAVETIEKALRRSKPFREWFAMQGSSGSHLE